MVNKLELISCLDYVEHRKEKLKEEIINLKRKPCLSVIQILTIFYFGRIKFRFRKSPFF